MNGMQDTRRICWIDNAKALGIIVVFYGHIVENIYMNYNPNAYLQLKLIYSFHMPLFFIISGYSSYVPDSNFRKYLKIKFFTRIVPVISFNLLILPLYFFQMMALNEIDIIKLISPIFHLLGGYPVLNFVTWFSLCLFTVETIQYFVAPICYGKKNKIIAGMVLFYIIGWAVSWKKNTIIQYAHMDNFWFFYQAVMAYSFYLFGRVLLEMNMMNKMILSKYFIGILFISAGVLFSTFNINQDVMRLNPQKIVIFAAGSYGNILLFPITAITGSLFVLLLSKAIGHNLILQYIGKNTLILMGLNGIFYHFFNNLIIKQFTPIISGAMIQIFCFCCAFTILSILLCFPMIQLLNKFFPQICGKPKINGPIIPNLIN